MEVLVITQARSGSTRLPNKVLKQIEGKSLLQIHIDRIIQATKISKVLVATTTEKKDDVIENLAKKINVDFYRGSQDDVLDRFYQTAKIYKPKYIVRLTSDCPLIDPNLLDEVIIAAKAKKLDYYANNLEERYPDGQDIEVFTFEALKQAWEEAKLTSEREHVTPYIRNNSTYKGGNIFKSDNHNCIKNYNHVRLTVDEQKDFEVIKLLINKLGLYKDWKTYADYYLANKEIYSLNQQITRNEGYLKSINEDFKT